MISTAWGGASIRRCSAAGVRRAGRTALGASHAQHTPKRRMRFKFNAVQIRFHAALAASKPRRLKRRKPRTRLIQPNTGSGIHLRRRQCARPCGVSSRSAMRAVAGYSPLSAMRWRLLFSSQGQTGRQSSALQFAQVLFRGVAAIGQRHLGVSRYGPGLLEQRHGALAAPC